jgi:hypothetical protein
MEIKITKHIFAVRSDFVADPFAISKPVTKRRPEWDAFAMAKNEETLRRIQENARPGHIHRTAIHLVKE